MMKFRSRKGIAAAVTVAFVMGAAVSALATELQSNAMTGLVPTTMDIFNGLSQVETSASPSLPPGQGGIPPAQPPGRAGGPELPPGQGGEPPGQPENRPPEFAQNDKEKEDKDQDVPEEPEEEEQE
jgi:hypothetical protein